MNTSIQPVADYVFAQEEEASSVTNNGIILPDSAVQKSKTAKAISVGESVKRVKAGERFIYKQYSSPELIKIKGVDYILLNEEDIIAKIPKASRS